MEDLSLILWRERELLETMLYKLEVEQLVLSSGRTRWLAHATRENYPHIHIIVASGYQLNKDLPEHTLFMRKPFLPLDLLREAERAQH